MVEFNIYPIQSSNEIMSSSNPSVKEEVIVKEETKVEEAKTENVQEKIKKEERKIRERNRKKDEINIEGLKELMKKYNYKLRFQEDEKAQLIYISIIDPETNKPVKEIPPEEVRKIKEYINSYLTELVGNNLDLKG